LRRDEDRTYLSFYGPSRDELTDIPVHSVFFLVLQKLCISESLEKYGFPYQECPVLICNCAGRIVYQLHTQLTAPVRYTIIKPFIWR